MTMTKQLDLTDSAVKANVDVLALELERAEFGIGRKPDPALMAPNIPLLDVPIMKAYRKAVRAEIKASYRPPELSKQPHKQRAAIAARVEYLDAEVAHREKVRREGRCDGGLRRLIDSQVRAEYARADLMFIDRKIKQTKQRREAVRDAERAATRDRLRELGFMP